MSTLVIELRQDDLMVMNGASMRFRSRTRIELTTRARFLFGKQVMAPETATTPARRIYFALQCAYVGSDEDRDGAMEQVRDLVAEFQAATTSALARAMLERALTLAETDDMYAALKLVRRVMQHEAAVLGGSAVPRSAGAMLHQPGGDALPTNFGAD